MNECCMLHKYNLLTVLLVPGVVYLKGGRSRGLRVVYKRLRLATCLLDLGHSACVDSSGHYQQPQHSTSHHHALRTPLVLSRNAAPDALLASQKRSTGRVSSLPSPLRIPIPQDSTRAHAITRQAALRRALRRRGRRAG